MKNVSVSLLFFAVLMLSLGCREKFEPVIDITDQNALVVEGFINAGAGPTSFRITRAQKFGYPEHSELHARVEVESEAKVIYPLNETVNGFYEASQLNLNSTEKYRLRIVTQGKEYLSDLELPKKAPAIDQITWKRSDDGVRLYVSTHDPENKTWYYQWDYEETWEYRSIYGSICEWNPAQSKVVGKDQSINIFRCWSGDKSPGPIMASSAKYAEDTINSHPILFIPNASIKLGVKYSILLKQSAVSRGAYEFYQLLKNNSELRGSIFDSQPTQLRGNIHCVSNPDELVIGYVSVIGNRAEKRIFIESIELYSPELEYWAYYLNCGADILPPGETEIYVPNDRVDLMRWYFQEGPNPPVPFDLAEKPYSYTKDTKRVIYKPMYPLYVPGRALDKIPPLILPGLLWWAAPKECVDCRVRGGTNVKPSYWGD